MRLLLSLSVQNAAGMDKETNCSAYLYYVQTTVIFCPVPVKSNVLIYLRINIHAVMCQLADLSN